jgi:glutaredoxin 3
MGSGFSNTSTTSSPSVSQTLNHENNPHLVYDEFIKSTLDKHKIVIFSKVNCIYCTKAKSALNQLKLTYHSIELDKNEQCPNENCANLSQRLILQTRIRTVPQIFINGKFIGGFTDLDNLIKKDELKNYLD